MENPLERPEISEQQEEQSNIVRAIHEAIKEIILEPVRSLLPFPSLRVAVPDRKYSRFYQHSFEIPGILVAETQKEPGLLNQEYIVITPRGLVCFTGGLKSKRKEEEILPNFDYSHPLPVQDYVTYENQIINKIAEELVRRNPRKISQPTPP